jgi:hypothetical protein
MRWLAFALWAVMACRPLPPDPSIKQTMMDYLTAIQRKDTSHATPKPNAGHNSRPNELPGGGPKRERPAEPFPVLPRERPQGTTDTKPLNQRHI